MEDNSKCKGCEIHRELLDRLAVAIPLLFFVTLFVALSVSWVVWRKP